MRVTGSAGRLLRRPADGVLVGPVAAGGGWVGVYLLICASGQRFSTDYLRYGWQLAPFENLRAHPFASVWNLHIQPPLWNLTIGVIARWSPLPTALSLQLLMATFGAVAAALLYDALRCFGVRDRWALILALAAMLIPDVTINAFEPTYELPVATMLIGVVWIVARAQHSHRRAPWFFALAALATTVTMTRTLYHPAWQLLLLVGAALRWRRLLSRRTLAAGLLIPLLVVGGWMAKNKLLVGRFTLSTWSGMNLQRAVIPVLPLNTLGEMVADGSVSQVAVAGPFHSYEQYIPAVGPCLPRPGDPPELQRVERDGPDHVPNFNARCFLPVYDLAGEDARTVIRNHPDVYARGRLWAARVWFTSNSQPRQSPSIVLRSLYHVYDLGLIGIHASISTTDWGTPFFGGRAVTLHFMGLLVACTLACLLAAIRRRRHLHDLDLLIGYIAAWTLTTGICFELGEQARFRTMIDPLILAFGLLGIARWLQHIAQRKGIQ